MNRPRIFRWLRISFTAVCLLFWLLLMEAWARSYSWGDMLHGSVTKTAILDLKSGQGSFGIGVIQVPAVVAMPWSLQSDSLEKSPGFWAHLPPYRGVLGVGMISGRGFCYLCAPYWFIACVTALLGVAPWLPWRFSLRTLLIAVTLLCIGLGTLVYLAG